VSTGAGDGVSVILPAYNEGRSITTAIDRYAECLPRFCDKFEILVVNDGSTDNTLAAAEEAALGRSYVRVLTNDKNLGQVASLLRGFSEARGSIITHNGVDLPFDPEETFAILELMRRGSDVVVVERTNRRAYGMLRKLVSWCNIVLVQLMLRSPFTDHNFVQAYRRRVLSSVTVESRGVSTVTTELIIKATALGFSVRSLKSAYKRRPAGESSITVAKIVGTARELFRLWLHLRKWRQSLAARLTYIDSLSGSVS
jgi:glycosyltransferase involved in cell wall biosynthesis